MDGPTSTGRIRRLGFYFFALLVALNALLAIGEFLGDYSNEGEILGTSGVLSFAVLGLLANAPAIERGRWWPVALLGILAIVLWAALLIYAIWEDFYTDDGLEDLMWAALFVGLGASYISILSAIRLTVGQHPWRLVADVFAVAAVAFALVAVLDDSGSDEWVTPIAICVIIAVAFAVVLSVLGRLNRAEHTTTTSASFCSIRGPASPLEQGRGQQRCESCRTTFSIELHE